MIRASGLALLLLAAGPLAAQEADFLFREPRATLSLRGGWAQPRASSQIFDFTTEELTLERGDFSGFTVQGELALRVHDRVDVALGLGHAQTTTRSEFRRWLDQDDRPIEQTTRFSRTPITVGAKAYLTERGRSIGRFAWIPTSWAPWVGAGGGWMVYEFLQSGDFVDEETLEIFTKDFRSAGGAPTAHVMAGVDVSLSPRFMLTGEGRYLWGSDEMSLDFEDFDPIDLSGFQITFGFAARF